MKYLIRAACDCNIRVSINSNLTLVTDEILDTLFECKVRGILASIMSFNPKTHDKIAQTVGAHARTVDGIKMCVQRGFPVVTNTVVSKLNLLYIAGVIATK